MIVNRPLAWSLAAAIAAFPKECYRNSVLAFVHFENHRANFRHLFDDDLQARAAAYYVEGIASVMDGHLQIEHGWVEIGDHIVDVTLLDLEPSDYQGVVCYTEAEVWQRTRQDVNLPYFFHERDLRHKMGEAMHERYANTTLWAEVRRTTDGR